MEATAREFNQQASKMLGYAERGEMIAVTKNGQVVAHLIPSDHEEVPLYPSTPIGDIDIPALDLGAPMTNDDINNILMGMGG
ncbi:type II toxin-antitoxin system Phd/YefM family antitoxin [Streptomyces sp. NPDC058471]|uniref:type II toxin-antitoxin system Phd/YefM family antitoxin n=1 Tax=Streptomyces sp. NPDC058471 TaxID=3346516 RepID=UPI00364A2D4D